MATAQYEAEALYAVKLNAIVPAENSPTGRPLSPGKPLQLKGKHLDAIGAALEEATLVTDGLPL